MKKPVLPLVALGVISMCNNLENSTDLSTAANSLTSDNGSTTLALNEVLQDGDENLNFIDIGPFLRIIRASKKNEDFKKMVDFYGEKKIIKISIKFSEELSVSQDVNDENILIEKIKEVFTEFLKIFDDVQRTRLINYYFWILLKLIPSKSSYIRKRKKK